MEHNTATTIYVAGIGPGSPEDITPAVLAAVRDSDVVVGYKYYFQFITSYLRPGTECIDTGMKKERDRAEQAFALAEQGKTVCVISSGDAGIYGMTPLIYEMKRERDTDIEIVPLPGISAFQKAASLLGAPMGHDFCVISLSDLMTPWAVIEKRIKAAAVGDFVTAVYNPKSNGRYWQLHRLKELFMQERRPDTVVGYVRQAGREDEAVKLTTLQDFDPEDVDMFTIVIIGNSQSYQWQGKFITPRGYYGQSQTPQPPKGGERKTPQQTPQQTPQPPKGGENMKVGQSIMIQSFRTIMSELDRDNTFSPFRGLGGLPFSPFRGLGGLPFSPFRGLGGPSGGLSLWKLWPMLHAIHTTADFEMEKLLWMDDRATEILYNKVLSGTIKAIVTDVSMVTAGIRKGALERLDIEVRTYINDPRGAEMAKAQNITRAQAGMRLAIEDYPEGRGVLFAFGNAPTALLELCELIRKGKCHPEGIIGAPVGFVHVEESKHAAKAFRDIPKILIEGRKGGSNLAATLVNSILTYDDAKELMPGRDV